ncbi:MAG: hypothetical protein HWE14_12695 [Flavobacteriia bacterium]|nr:hypothetical protein [Flavobacteriia bacterium]
MHTNTRIFALLLLLVVIAFPLAAQPGSPSSPTPLGFTEVLIGAAAIYGGRKAMRRNKKV